jgi:hypothetical protein
MLATDMERVDDITAPVDATGDLACPLSDAEFKPASRDKSSGMVSAHRPPPQQA